MTNINLTFAELLSSEALAKTVSDLGYETPTPVQEKCIPILLAGHDLLAQAQTGTGKTAAFALPILEKIDFSSNKPQALVITPTRELAIQVAEAFQSYAKKNKKFKVTPIYGGQDYQIQLRALKRGPHVIVGTPGRVIDHLRRGTLMIDTLKTIVLDEADQMLNMGFIEDIETILAAIKVPHQTALFSATIPSSIVSIANNYLNNAKKINITPKKTTVDAIQQFYTRVSRNQKLDVLTRFLEVEEIDASIVFVRTKTISSELAEKLQARGYNAAALNGDMSQSMREKVITRLKKGGLDIIVATDVAARGIDVSRVSHVINYDIPHDVESYIHRIGRTGRAGKKGKSFLFVTPREQRLLRDIEHSIQKELKAITPPSLTQMKTIRQTQLIEKITDILDKNNHREYQVAVERIQEETSFDLTEVIAALIYLIDGQKDANLQELSPESDQPQQRRGRKRSSRRPEQGRRNRSDSAPSRSKPFRKKSSGPKSSTDTRKKPATNSKRRAKTTKN